jgi:parallel beta-helix repeat protein
LSADYGIYINSNNNHIYGNNIDYKTIDYGIALRGDNNIVNNNYIETNTNFGAGISLESTYNNIVDSNHIKKHYCGIDLRKCTKGYPNLIINNTIEQSGTDGILFNFLCSNIEVTNNNISYCNRDERCTGIRLDETSCNNSIHKNLLTYNAIGISIYPDDNNNNTIYHNSFLGNNINAKDRGNNIWDDGNKGNYWDDYRKNYPFARKVSSEGIWNTPYDIPNGNNQDRYPLIKSYHNSLTKTRTINLISFDILNKVLNRFPMMEWFFRGSI